MKRFAFLLAVALLITGSPAHADPLTGVAKRLVKGLSGLTHKKIAVLSFPYHDGCISSGSSIISEHLTNLLVDRKGVQVIERTLLSKMMGEMKLEESGVTESSDTQKLGKVLGVDAIVTGTLIDLDDNQTEVNARLIKTDTGEVLAAATTRVDRTWKDLPNPPVEVNHQEVRYESPMVYTPIKRAGGMNEAMGSQQVVALQSEDLYATVPHQQPEVVVQQYVANPSAPPLALNVARRIYQRNPNPKTRAKALYAMGVLLERQGRPAGAEASYRQLVNEFPGQPAIQQMARQRLATLNTSR